MDRGAEIIEKVKPAHLVGADRIVADRMWRDPAIRKEFEDQTHWTDPQVGEYHVAFRLWAADRLVYEAFRGELESVINRHSMERRGGDTPDFLLAEYLTNCLRIFDGIVKRRDAWYGNKGQADTPPILRDSDFARHTGGTFPHPQHSDPTIGKPR